MQIWDNVTQPIGAVQIIKSMDTTYHRYDKIAKILNQNGYLVFCNKRYQQDGNVFAKAVAQETKTLDKIKQKYNLPLFLVGHGFGGFVAQELISHANKCNGVICSAGGERLSKITQIQCMITTWVCQRLFGHNASAKMIPKIHRQDNGITYNHMYWILKGIKNIQYDKNTATPQMFICGKRDIIGANNRLAWTLYNAYNMHDLHKTTFILRPNVTTPIESPEHWSDVQGDILQFLGTHANKPR